MDSQVTLLRCSKCGQFYEAWDSHQCEEYAPTSDFSITEDDEPMTFKKVEEFIDTLPISKTDMHELKSRISDLEQDTHMRAYNDGYDNGYSDGHALGARNIQTRINNTEEK